MTSRVHFIQYADGQATVRKSGYNRHFDKAIEYSNKALLNDKAGRETAALKLYKMSLEYVLYAISNEDNEISKRAMEREFSPMINRAEELRIYFDIISEAKLLGSRAIDADNLRNWPVAKDFYAKATDKLIRAVKLVHKDSPTRPMLKERATLYIQRAEAIRDVHIQRQNLPLASAPPPPPAYNPAVNSNNKEEIGHRGQKAFFNVISNTPTKHKKKRWSKKNERPPWKY